MKETQIGFLLIISGASGAGKDTVMTELLRHPRIKDLHLKKVVTCTDRHPRPGETHGIDYHFVTRERLQQMAEGGELVEEITLTGSSRKATPKSEIERLLKGEDLVWRIDPSRAAEVASKGFFARHFPRHAQILQKRTTVLCVTAPKDTIDARRKVRDGDGYNPNEYSARDEQELPHLRVLKEKAVVIENPEGHLKEAVEIAADLTVSSYGKAKNKSL